MKEVGTLSEIGARVGDVVRFGRHHNEYVIKNIVGDVYYHDNGKTLGQTQLINGFQAGWCIILRAAKPFNTLTAEEKGALLLANLEGKIIEMSLDGGDTWDRSYTPQWIGAACYRVKADEVKEVRLIGAGPFGGMWDDKNHIGYESHRITFNLINGKPDCASVKMEEI